MLDRTRWSNSRKIAKRFVVRGELTLETPVHLGNGDNVGPVDMTLFLDPLEGRAILTGSSLAGALRSYLRTREIGYRQDAATPLTDLLFGPHRTQDGAQSWLIAEDALGPKPAIELRDGVAIDAKTHTAAEHKKYDLELLEAGAVFPLCFELLAPAELEADLKKALAAALEGFERGDIGLGARKARGFGKCKVPNWQVDAYDLRKPDELVGWLERRTNAQSGAPIAVALDVKTAPPDQRAWAQLEATLALDSSLLIRSASADPNAPDMIHLHSQRPGGLEPVLSGTSLAGALRSRAQQIANTVGAERAAKTFIDSLFGPRIESSDDDPSASRLWVGESEIKHGLELVVQRVKIDRFTGGSFPTALFSEQPVFGKTDTTVAVTLKVRNPSTADLGLLLLLLKDLWTSDLPLGGESSVGRGRLSGREASLTWHQPGHAAQTWRIAENRKVLTVDGPPIDCPRVEGQPVDAKALQAGMQCWVDAFVQEVQRETV